MSLLAIILLVVGVAGVFFWSLVRVASRSDCRDMEGDGL